MKFNGATPPGVNAGQSLHPKPRPSQAQLARRVFPELTAGPDIAGGALEFLVSLKCPKRSPFQMLGTLGPPLRYLKEGGPDFGRLGQIHRL
jgi:hypothetical protein